jgi:deoxyribodipyrimidine photo-lyase
MRLDRESIGVEANDAGTTRTTGTTGTTGTTVVWFRRDLRLHDHPALTDALANGGRIAPLFVVDERLVSGRWPAPNRVAFMLRSVAALRDALEAHGGRLFVRVGRPDDVVPAFAAEVRADRVLASRDYGPYARRRDRDVDAALGGVGAALRLRRGVLVHEPEELLTAAGAPFRVFSPFRRAWDARPRRQVLPLPGRSRSVHQWHRHGTIPSLASLGIGDPSPSIPEAGEAAARGRLERWVGDGLERYAERRDRLDLDGTSRLSQDLHWGLLSPLEVVEACSGPGRSRERFVSELTWRDFYHASLPRTRTSPSGPTLRRTMRSRPRGRRGARGVAGGRTGTRWSTRRCASYGARLDAQPRPDDRGRRS